MTRERRPAARASGCRVRSMLDRSICYGRSFDYASSVSLRYGCPYFRCSTSKFRKYENWSPLDTELNFLPRTVNSIVCAFPSDFGLELPHLCINSRDTKHHASSQTHFLFNRLPLRFCCRIMGACTIRNTCLQCIFNWILRASRKSPLVGSCPKLIHTLI